MTPRPSWPWNLAASRLCAWVVALGWLGQLATAAAAQVFLRVNSVGYQPHDVKIAVGFGDAQLPGEFHLRQSDTGQVVYQGKTKLAGEQTWGVFKHHVELDFSRWQTPGRYTLTLGPASPVPFDIQTNLFASLPDQLLEFMRQQRCGYNPWLEAACHQSDGRTAYGPQPPGTALDARGGWHDAADLLKYLLTSANATAQMLLAYRLAPASFADRFDAIGKPGTNGIPDVLDEARWGLEWMLRLHPAPGQLYHQVADDRDHCGWRLPANDPADYGWGTGGARVVYFADGSPQGLRQYQSASTGVANLAGRYAAAMALAHQVWQRHPSLGPFARQCLQAGKEVYELGCLQEGVQQGNSHNAPYRYSEATWTDDMEWGAAELYRCTREPRYLEQARHYARMAADISWMGREQTEHYEFYPFVNLGHYALHDQVEQESRRLLAQHYRAGIKRCLAVSRENPYRIGVPFIWCSNHLTVALVTQCLLYERMTGEHRYQTVLAAHRDWLLGRNPWGYSMFTGIPAAGPFPRHPHLMTTRLTGRPIRGGLVDGPVYARIFKTLRGVRITEPDPLAPFQSELAVYHDDLGDYATNEPTMDGTASALLMFALF